MQPASFWKRLGATIIDTIIYMPIFFYIFELSYRSKNLAYALAVPLSLSWSLFLVFFHGRFGATPGKMLLKIKVVDVSGGKISYRQAFRRQVVDIGFAASGAILTIVGIGHVSDDLFLNAVGKGLFSSERLALLTASEMPLQRLLTTLSSIWFALEFITLLFNKEKRAVHDFIGRTRVITSSFAV